VLRIDHPDGTPEFFTYNALGQVLTHTDGKGQTTRLLRTARGLPSSRQDAKGQRIRYEYDKAIRLTHWLTKTTRPISLPTMPPIA